MCMWVCVTQAATDARKRVNELDNATSAKAVDALLSYETVTLFNNHALEIAQVRVYARVCVCARACVCDVYMWRGHVYVCILYIPGWVWGWGFPGLSQRRLTGVCMCVCVCVCVCVSPAVQSLPEGVHASMSQDRSSLSHTQRRTGNFPSRRADEHHDTSSVAQVRVRPIGRKHSMAPKHK